MKNKIQISLKKKLIYGIVISIILSTIFIYQHNEEKKKQNKLQMLSDKYYGKSVIEYQRQAFSKALIYIDKAISYVKNEKNYQLRVTINQSLIDIDAMINDYTNLIKLNNQNTAYFNDRGNLYLSKNNYEKAIADFENSLKLKLKQESIIKLLQNAYMQIEKYDKAYQWAQKLYQLNNNEENYLLYLQAGYFNKKYDEILKDALKSYQSKPSDALATIVANCYYQKGKYPKALEYYNFINGKSSEIYLLMGYASYLNEDYQKAKEYLLLSNNQDESVLAMINGCDQYLNNRGEELAKSKFLDENGNFVNDYYKYLAYEYYNQSDYLQTIKYLLIYLEKTNDASQYFVLANCYNLIENYDEAITYYSKSIDHDLESGNCYYNRGIIYLNKQQYQNAVTDFEHSYELNIKPDYSKYNQGIAYMNMSKFKESTQCFLKVVAISSDQDLITKAKDILSRYYVS